MTQCDAARFGDVGAVIRLKHCCILPADWGCLTVFEDGTEVPSVPDWTGAHYAVISHRTGYGDDRLRYCIEHEVAHAFVAEKLYDEPSQVLWALAHGKPLSGKRAAYEEFMAQGFQRWLRANERPILGGVPWDDWKAEALELLGG